MSHPHYNNALGLCVGIWSFLELKSFLIPHLSGNELKTTLAMLGSFGGALGAFTLAQEYPRYATVTCVAYGLYNLLQRNHHRVRKHL